MILEYFWFAFSAIAPILLLIGLGYALKTSGFLPPEFFKAGNRFSFYVCLPVLLFYNVYEVEDIGSIRLSSAVYACAVVLLLFGLGLVLTLFIAPPERKGPVLQCAFRSNYAVIGLSLASAVGGGDLSGASVLVVFSIPLFNVLAVIALSVFSEDKRIRPRQILKKIAKNPLILGVLAGVLALLVRKLMPAGADGLPVFTVRDNLGFVYKVVEMLAAMASPFALIMLGGQFSFGAVPIYKKEILLGTAARIAAAPLIGLGGAVLLNRLGVTAFGAGDFAAFTALFGSPVAVSSAVMAGQMGSDEQLAGQLVLWTSLGSIFTVFLTVVLLKYYGFV